MSSYLRATHLIDLCTPSISYDRQVQSACKAFDEQMFEIIDDTGQVIMIPDIMNISDEKLVDILAWQFHVDFYDTTKDLEFRKKLVQMSIIWHKTKGTLSLVQDVIDTYWPGGAHIEEWFDYKWPFPPNYPTVAPDTNLGNITAGNINLAQNRIESFANTLTNGKLIRFQTPSVGRLPSPLVQGVWYVARDVTPTSFRVSTQPVGPLITLTTVGSGTHIVWLHGTGDSWHDRYRFRVMLDQNVVTPEETEAVVTLIDRYKPVSRWCEGVYRVTNTDCYIGVTGMVLRFIYRESQPPDDRSPGPEPHVYDVNAYLNRMLDPATVEAIASNVVGARVTKTLAPITTDIHGSSTIVGNLSKTVGPVTLSSGGSGPSNPYKVHFVYLIPSDQPERATARIKQMGFELRRWLRWRMGNGKTFTPYDPVDIVQVYHTDHDQAWYPNHNAGGDQSGWYWNNTLGDLARYAGGGFYQQYHTWFCYVDSEPNQGQYAGGTGGGYTSGCCVLGWHDLNALMGIAPDWTVCREIGGAGHEYLHTHSAPHAEQEWWNQSIMGIGYMSYPSCILQPSMITLLNASPFYTVIPPEEMKPLSLCSFNDGLGT